MDTQEEGRNRREDGHKSGAKQSNKTHGEIHMDGRMEGVHEEGSVNGR
jgi:hypothetical protein